MTAPAELAAEARRQLSETRFGDVRWVASTGSTNADLLELAAGGDAADVVLLAEEQSAGRGRLGRSWTAPPGSSLLCSILLRPQLTPGDAHLATAAVALAARDAVAVVAGFTPDLKWPNDLVVDAADGVRKLAGVLAESRLVGDRLDAVVVGIGCNVAWPEHLPDELAAIATSCNHVAGHPVDRVAVLVALLRNLEHRAAQLDGPEGRAQLAVDYGMRCSTVGRHVRVELPGDDELVGQAVGISGAGHLLVEVIDGDGQPSRHEVAVGDVVHLRDADRPDGSGRVG